MIICNKDPHQKVAGKGIELLEKNGTTVSSGVLEKEGEWVNRRFFKTHRDNLPYVILKWAENQNGLMDSLREDSETGINWITKPETKTLVHQWRSEEDAILVGANTVLNDSPMLNLRLADGKNPLRVVIDPNHRIPSNHEFWKLKTPTLVISRSVRTINSWTEVKALDKNDTLINQTLKILAEMNILSVIIEGGAHTLNSFIKENAWDEARILTGKNNWTKGLKSPSIKGFLVDSFDLNTDQVRIIKRDLTK